MGNIEPEEGLYDHKNDKIGSLAFFNRIDTIEESKSVSSEELEEQPTIRKTAPKTALKGLPRKEIVKQSLPNPPRKVENTRRQVPKQKGVNLKNDMMELDRMKKEL